jgi:D-proline reductase (dithiol) PrdB
VTLAMEHGVSAPRAGFVPFPYNLPMGEPHDREGHKRIALAALALLYEMEQPGEVELQVSGFRLQASRKADADPDAT